MLIAIALAPACNPKATAAPNSEQPPTARAASFQRTPAEAYRIMMAVHTQGQGLCGVYPFEVAETKVATVVELARGSGFPLRAAMEPE